MNSAPLGTTEKRASPNQPRKNVQAKEVPPVQARQGATLGHMRYVLAISLALVIVAFAIIYFLYF